jgi:hypothetical protein
MLAGGVNALPALTRPAGIPNTTRSEHSKSRRCDNVRWTTVIMTQITMCASGEVIEGHFWELGDGDLPREEWRAPRSAQGRRGWSN